MFKSGKINEDKKIEAVATIAAKYMPGLLPGRLRQPPTARRVVKPRM
jgi:hypothetical protein